MFFSVQISDIHFTAFGALTVTKKYKWKILKSDKNLKEQITFLGTTDNTPKKLSKNNN